MTVGKKRFSFGQVLLNVFFLLIVLTVAVPVINLAARSFASAKGALQMHGFSLWPSDPTLLNYQVVFSNRLILPSLWNNIVITVLGTAVNLLITLMAAYAVTRPRLVGKKFFMGFFIVMMLFNPGLMPEYLVVKQLKLIDSMWSVILVGAVNVYRAFQVFACHSYCILSCLTLWSITCRFSSSFVMSSTEMPSSIISTMTW